MTVPKSVVRFGKAYAITLAVVIAIPLLFISAMVLSILPFVLYSIETGTDVFDPAEVPLWIHVVQLAWGVGIVALIGTAYINHLTEENA